MKKRAATAIALVAAASLLALRGARSARGTVTPAAPRLDGSTIPPIDLGAVMDQVHYAFRQRDGAWRGGHSTYEVTRHEGGALEVKPWHHPREGRRVAVEGDPVRFAPASVGRGAALLAGGAGRAATNDKGQLEIAHGGVVERLKNGPSGVEQSWQLAERPAGQGELEVRIAVEVGSFVGETERGLHFTAGTLGIRYGNATWIDGLGVRTPVLARWDSGAIVMRVPADVVEGSVYPAVLDPVIGPEVAMSQDVYGSAPNHQYYPVVAWDGTNHLVVWWDTRPGQGAVYAARVRGSDGAVLDRNGIEICNNWSELEFPAIAWDGTANFLVVWDDRRSGDADIYGARVRASDGSVLEWCGVGVSTATGTNETMPALAWDGTDFLVVWADQRNASSASDIYGARVRSSDAAVLDAGGFAISTASGTQSRPAVAHGPGRSLVVWEDYRNGNFDVYGARVSGASVLDGSGIAIAQGARHQSAPDVAWDGSNYLVVWQEPRGTTSYDVCGARVKGSDGSVPGSEGTVLDPAEILISTASAGVGAADAQMNPAVAWDGAANFLVVWDDARNVYVSQTDIYGARVRGSDGAVLDAAGLELARLPSGQAAPALAFDGTSFLLVWQDYRSETNYDIYGARVRRSDMAVLDSSGFAISTELGQERYPSVASNGTDYLAVWQDYRNGGSWDVYGARISGVDATVMDASGIAISTQSNDQIRPSVAWNGTDYVVAWEDHRTGLGDVYGARVRSSDGSVRDATGIAISTNSQAQTAPSIACSTGSCLVAWQDARSDAGDVYGALVAGDGTVPLTDIAVCATGFAQTSPVVGWNGSDYVTAWQDSRSSTAEIYAGRVSGAGSPLDGTGFPVPTTAGTDPAIACSMGTCLVVWKDSRTLWPEIWGARLGTGGTVLDSSGIPILTDTQSRGFEPSFPAVAWDGKSWIVAWQDLRGTANWDVYYSRVHAAGVVVEDRAGGYPVTPGGTEGERDVALAASAQNRILAVYDARDSASGQDPYRVRMRSIQLDHLNLAPTAAGQSVTLAEDGSIAITLSATDLDGDPLIYAVSTQPAHGALTGTGANLTYAPAANFHGSDSFTFTASDATHVSTAATVSITVTSVNDAPVATPLSLSVTDGNSLPIPLSGSDVDGDPLTYAVVTVPAHGALGGTPPSLVYTPEPGYAGPDSFTFRANDGALDSQSATVSITVRGTASATGVAGKLSAYGCSSSGGGTASLLLLAIVALALRRTGRRGLALLAALAVALPLAAEAAPRKDAKTRVAVMKIRAGLGTDPKLAELVTDSLVANLTDRGLTTITSKDVESALGFERQKQMLGCGSESCLAEIAGALGADRVVFGDVAQVQGLTIFSVQLFNTRTGSVEKRFHERMRGGDAADLLDAADRAAAELFPGTVASGQATHKRSVLTSTAHPLALVVRGGYDVQEPGGFGVLMLEYRVGRSVRIGAGALGTGATSFGAAVRAAWYPLVLSRLSVGAAVEGHLLFPAETLVAASVSLNAELAFTQRFAIAVEAPVTIMVSAPEKYRQSYFMPGLAASWRF